MAENKAQDGWGEEMDVKSHLTTYDAFIEMSKWGTVGIAVLLILMAFFLL
ncbi:MAG: aa3-type cytochrome c oxidase subunit IV [Parvibaculum sp.]|nr:aa3-type cytochrome c oxidase subunit IV [Parvibaculum sp.]MBX3489052.1 aa3-type cytochrome c oxidase subunit IV [Parvibaculum sp.]MBX3496523.1 aa3-type cytochrome c oxidase subunit IV [Parvibaculum sp.]MCW5727079.1 aa3-type cytochrome c oxidase subunit IV [Parvibaculum sp.]